MIRESINFKSNIEVSLKYIKLNCTFCNKEFSRTNTDVNSHLQKKCKNQFCSRTCLKQFMTTKQIVNCAQCQMEIYRTISIIKKSKTKNFFCTKSCSALYNNTHKIKGNRKSKLESWIEKQLILIYPNLEILFNQKKAINSELDIYIPSLKIAFELNGIFHYEPIFGKDKLTQINNNDQRKFQACLENGIERD